MTRIAHVRGGGNETKVRKKLFLSPNISAKWPIRLGQKGRSLLQNREETSLLPGNSRLYTKQDAR